MHQLTHRSLRLVLLALVLATLSGCFEEPVEEVLVVTPTQEGALHLALHVRLAIPEGVGDESRPAVEQRLRDAEAAYLGGYDDWSRRFERIATPQETMSWTKHEGRLQKIERSALVTDPDELGNFLADTGISVSFSPQVSKKGTHGTLAFFAGSSTRASREQSEQVDQAFKDWGQSVIEYLEALKDLFVYLENKPLRARSTLGYLLSERLSEEDLETIKPLKSGPEQTTIDTLETAMLAVADILTPKEGQAFSLNELSSLAFDPFPATVIVELPSPATEMVGFSETEAKRRFKLQTTSLVGALEQLSGDWLTLDPLSLWLEGQLDPDAPELDLGQLTKTSRSIDVPADREAVLEALRDRLQPATEYRLTW